MIKEQILVLSTMERLHEAHGDKLFLFDFWSGPEGECIARFKWVEKGRDEDCSFKEFLIVSEGDRDWGVAIRKLCERAVEGLEK